jgi:hypothetical protein
MAGIAAATDVPKSNANLMLLESIDTLLFILIPWIE